ncbi:MAG TPA: rhomboid family intramembrane serine protease [Ktedonobacterales bacterium]
MEQTTDARALIEKGDELLKELRVNEAAAEFARAAQLDPSAVGAHLGLAEANLALGQYNVAQMACQATERLAPNTADAYIAQAIQGIMAQRFDAVMTAIDRAIELDPPRAYAHALRGFALRQLRQSYDASLAESKAARMSGTHDLPKLFPPVNPVVPEVFGPAPIPGQPAAMQAAPQAAPQAGPRPWQDRSNVERAAVRARFATRNIPVVTFALIAINTIIFVVSLAFSNFDLMSTADPRLHPNNPLYNYGIEIGLNYIRQDPTQVYRIFTGMFLHESIIHLGFNMLSLYFVGIITEQIFGRGRFLAIYLLSGVIAGVAQAVLVPDGGALGASGAIFGIFGAFGVFFLLYRRVLGSAANAVLGQWFFWLVLNLVFSFSASGVALYDHLGGLIAGLALGALLVPGTVTRRR